MVSLREAKGEEQPLVHRWHARTIRLGKKYSNRGRNALTYMYSSRSEIAARLEGVLQGAVDALVSVAFAKSTPFLGVDHAAALAS